MLRILMEVSMKFRIRYRGQIKTQARSDPRRPNLARRKALIFQRLFLTEPVLARIFAKNSGFRDAGRKRCIGCLRRLSDKPLI
ncbi:hypothetical protein [Achromobacter piechaudii]|uniref:hypothetical protein n=1 Tax=Achromobacter piechaudii TaxID=72556 RepID=UPI0012E1420F|nr:hypothetical protein [Achromobacter piechaudii]